MALTSLGGPEWLLLALGFGGQALFSARMLVQWLASEKHGRSTVPVAFWHLSLLGGVALFAYAACRRDPVFMLGQGFGLVVYGRNLWLIHKPRPPAAQGSALATADERA